MLSFAVIVTTANAFLRPIHDRMPVILHRDDYDRWLDPSLPAEAAQALLAPYAGAMTAVPVTSVVNNPRNDDIRCLTSIEEPLTGGGAIDLSEGSGSA